MPLSRRLKIFRQKLDLAITLLTIFLLMFGCFFCYYKLSVCSLFYSLIIPCLFLLNVIVFIYWFLKKIKYIYIPLIGLFVYFVFFNAPIQINIADDNTGEILSLMTFNVRGFGAKSKKILDFTKSENPDIICFQEFSRYELQSFSYYPYNFIGYRPEFKKTLQVIYSKYPIVDKGFVDFPNTKNQTIYVDINFEGEIIRVYNIHLQSYMLGSIRFYSNLENLRMFVDKVNTTQSMQVEQVQIILDHAKMFKGKVVFSGDFNSTQYSSNYKRLKQNKNDSFIESGFGFGATYSRRNYPLRIDYVLVDKGIEVLSHQNFDLKYSDHEPILTKLVVN